MEKNRPADLVLLTDMLDAIDRDLRAVLDGLSDERAAWRANGASWSIAECIDHLATANRVYLAAMTPAAETARAAGRMRRGPATPGLFGGWFARSLEPPVRPLRRIPARRKLKPRAAPPLQGALTAFNASQQAVRDFLDTYAGIDLAGVTFPNPIVPGIRFSLATGLHVVASHERRHLWQMWNIRRALQP